MYVNSRAILERDGAEGVEVLLQIRDRPHESRPRLELPGGQVEEFEPILEALVREVREETGLNVTEIIDDTHRHVMIDDEVTEFPALLKTRRFGYDGKGQRLVETRPGSDPRHVLEGLVAFGRELSLVCVRGRGGETRFYPLAENVHDDGILRVSRAPAETTGSASED